MANAIYQEYKQNLLAGTSGYDLDNDQDFAETEQL